MEPVDPAGARPVIPFRIGFKMSHSGPWPRPIGASLFGGLLSLFRGLWLTLGSLALFLTSSGAQEDLDRGKTPVQLYASGCATETSQGHTQSLAARPPDNGWPLDSARARPHVHRMSALRETRGVVVVRCLHCGREGSLSRTTLVRFGLDPNAPIAAYVKRLRCSKCGSSSVMAKRTTQPNTEQDRRKRRA
jgi:hypothetical protein